MQLILMTLNPDTLPMGPPRHKVTSPPFSASSQRYLGCKLEFGVGIFHIQIIFLKMSIRLEHFGWIYCYMFLLGSFPKIWVMAASVCLVFTVTIGIFPAVTVHAVSTVATDTPWGK